jgi:hypothetical protein
MHQVSIDRRRADASSHWWRWAILPAAAVLALIVTGGFLALAEHVLVGLLFSVDNAYLRYCVPVEASVIGGFAFSWAACAVAPCGKRIAGTVLVTLLGVFAAFGAVAEWGGDSRQPVANSLQYIAYLASAIVGLAMYRDDRLSRLAKAINEALASTERHDTRR